MRSLAYVTFSNYSAAQQFAIEMQTNGCDNAQETWIPQAADQPRNAERDSKRNHTGHHQDQGMEHPGDFRTLAGAERGRSPLTQPILSRSHRQGISG
jgi:hypothetical protein